MPTIDAIRGLLNAGRSWNDINAAVTVAAPVALTSAVAVAAPTKAEYDALRQDVINLRATVASLLTANQTTGFVG
jgi:hypothetical protein